MSILGWLMRRGPRGDLHVVMYTRAGCHLCDDAWAELERLRAEYGFAMCAKDIDADADLRTRFNECVPVVEVNGKVRSRGRFNPILFQRLLDAK